MSELWETSKFKTVPLIFKEHNSRWGFSYFVVKNQATKKLYWMTETELFVLLCMKNEVNFEGLIQRLHDRYEGVDSEEVKNYILKLSYQGLLTVDQKLLNERNQRRENARTLSIRLISSDTFIRLGALRKRVKFAFTRKVKKSILAFTLLLIPFILYVNIFTRPTVSVPLYAIYGSPILGWALLLLILVPVLAIHELSHAISCLYYGVEPREAGIGFEYFFPYLYTDTSESWFLDKKQRVWISVSGPISTIVVATAFITFSKFYFVPYDVQSLLNSGGFLCLIATLINLCPFIESDGYYILMDVLDIPNLRDLAFKHLIRKVRRIRSEDTRLPFESPRLRTILMGFGFVSLSWMAFFTYIGSSYTIALLKEAWSSIIFISQGQPSLLGILNILVLSSIGFLMVAATIRSISNAMKVLKD